MWAEIAKAVFELVAMIIACQVAAYRGRHGSERQIIYEERKSALNEAERTIE
jgi:hypothetical protein